MSTDVSAPAATLGEPASGRPVFDLVRQSTSRAPDPARLVPMPSAYALDFTIPDCAGAASAAPITTEHAPVEASKPAVAPATQADRAPSPAPAIVTSVPAPGPEVTSSPPKAQTTAALNPPLATSQAPPSPIKAAHAPIASQSAPAEGTKLGDPTVAYEEKHIAEESVPPKELEKAVAEVQAGAQQPSSTRFNHSELGSLMCMLNQLSSCPISGHICFPLKAKANVRRATRHNSTAQVQAVLCREWHCSTCTCC